MGGGGRGLPARGTEAFEGIVGRVRAAYPILSPTQTAVAIGVWRSLADKEIADWLGCSVHTVRGHEEDILGRLRSRGIERRGDIILAVERVLREPR